MFAFHNYLGSQNRMHMLFLFVMPEICSRASRALKKWILASPRYYFFDIGVRNALSRVPLTESLINADKGRLFEYAVVLELIRRIRAMNLDYKAHPLKTVIHCFECIMNPTVKAEDEVMCFYSFNN